MRKKLLMLALVLVATAAATLTAPRQAEAAFCNKTCCGINSCSCCSSVCQCPIPGR